MEEEEVEGDGDEEQEEGVDEKDDIKYQNLQPMKIIKQIQTDMGEKSARKQNKNMRC